MSTEITVGKDRQLPTLNDLHHDPEEAFKLDAFMSLMYGQPPKQWLKKNKMADDAIYVPIDKVELMLDRIFQLWKVEVISHQQLFNSVSCHIRLHYVHPVTGQWQFHDGVGAHQLQLKKGSTPSEINNLTYNAVGMALPIAKSLAIKDACHHLGRVFGRDLNREELGTFNGSYTPPPTLEELKTLYELKKEHLTTKEVEYAERIISLNEVASFTKLFNQLKAL